MKNITVEILLAVISVAAFSSSARTELVVEKSGQGHRIARSVSSNFGANVRTHCHFLPVQSIAANSYGEIAAGLANGEIAIWNSAASIVERTIAAHKTFVSSVQYLANGNLVSSGYDSHARLWNAQDSYSLKSYAFFGDGTQRFNKVLSIPIPGYYAIARLNVVTVMNSVNYDQYPTQPTHAGEVVSLALLANEDLVTGSADTTIKIWNWRNSTLKRTLTGHSGCVTELLQLPTGELVSGSADRTIKIWNPNDGTLIRSMNAQTGPITGLVVLQNGLLASSSSSDNMIRIWDAYRGVNTFTFTGPAAGINDLALLSSGELASAGSDGSVRIWATK